MKRHKFNARLTTDDKHTFHSILEHKFYKQLIIRQKAGDVIFFLRQVPIHLPGGVKYVVDYLIFNSDETVSFVDVKGMETAEFKMKKKMVEALYPISIEIVKKV